MDAARRVQLMIGHALAAPSAAGRSLGEPVLQLGALGSGGLRDVSLVVRAGAAAITGQDVPLR
ncbi:MAG: hypothetical protein U0802_10710 [Candidatus Binatia bacterium]